MFPLVYPEISDYDLLRVLNHGTIPSHYKTSHLNRMLNAYIEDYLIQEIQAEGFIRNLQHFARFLEAAAFSNSQLINYTNIARDCGIDSKTVKEYFYLLEDTLIGTHVYPFTKTRRRDIVTQTPKFYFFDVGVANGIQKKKLPALSGSDAGQSLETYLFHELKAFCHYNELDMPLPFGEHEQEKRWILLWEEVKLQ
jgi:predicted AAA+ superfamily ATPase